MRLKIISPQATNEYTVSWFEFETDQGSCTIQLGHAPMVAVLAANKLLHYQLQNGKQDSIMIHAGIVEIGRTDATVLLNQAL